MIITGYSWLASVCLITCYHSGQPASVIYHSLFQLRCWKWCFLVWVIISSFSTQYCKMYSVAHYSPMYSTWLCTKLFHSPNFWDFKTVVLCYEKNLGYLLENMQSYFKDRILLQYDCCHTRAKSPMHGVSKGFYTTFVSWLVTPNEQEAFSRLDVTEN